MKEFFRKNKVPLIVIFVIGVIAYSVKLVTYTVSIDTEILMYNPRTLLKSWVSIGRWGLVGIKELFHLLPINIMITDICAFLIFFISIIIWFVNFEKILKKDSKLGKIVFGLIIITTPIFAEQFYFSLQSIEVAIAFLMLAIAIFFQERWIIDGKKWCIFPTIILITFTFGCYQAFIPLYISICLFDYISNYDRKINIKRILKYLLIFIIALVLNYIFDRIFRNIYEVSYNARYLKSQILWGTERKYFTLTRVVYSIINSFVGIGCYETIAYGVFFVLMTIVVATKLDLKDNKFFYLVYFLFFLIVPFATGILKGVGEVSRAKFCIPFITGFVFYYILCNTDNKKILSILKVTGVYAVVIQTVVTFSLFYLDYQRYSEDVRIANKVEDDLKSFDTSKPIVFVGAYKTPDTIIKGETMGASFFAHDANSNLGCTYRALGFMKTLGMKHDLPSLDEISEARENLNSKLEKNEVTLSVYPNKGYIIELEKYIIVSF